MTCGHNERIDFVWREFCLEKQVGSRAVGWGITGKQSGARIQNNIERLLENSYFVLYL